MAFYIDKDDRTPAPKGYSVLDAIGGLFGGAKKDTKDTKDTKSGKTTAGGRSVPRGASSYGYSMPMDREPMSQEIFEGLRERETPGLALQRRGYKDLLDQVENYKKEQQAKPVGTDLTPLMMASDMIAGTDYLSKYKAPKSKAERDKELMGLERALLKEAGGLSKSELNLLKAQFQPKGGTITERVGFPKAKGTGKGQKEPTANQYKAAGFGRRLEQAEKEFSALDKEGYDRTTMEEAAASSWLVPEMWKGGPTKRQSQAERNFVNAILRRESGAAISSSEFSSAEKQYFPRVGDTPQVLAQKKANRAQVLNALRAESAGAWERVTPVTTPRQLQEMEKKAGYADLFGGLLKRSEPAQQERLSSQAGKGAAGKGAAGIGAAPRKKRPSFEEWKKQKGL